MIEQSFFGLGIAPKILDIRVIFKTRFVYPVSTSSEERKGNK